MSGVKRNNAHAEVVSSGDRCAKSQAFSPRVRPPCRLGRYDRRRRSSHAALAETATKPTPSPDKPPQTTELSAELQAEGELKYRWIIQKYGSRLTDAEKQDIHRLVMEAQKPLATFRAFPLDNADQPATVLKFTDAAISGEGSCA